MDQGKLEEYRRRLTEERARLTRSMNRNRRAADEIRVEHTEDEGDLAIISHDQELLCNLNEKDLTWLKSILEAVERIDRNQYGECTGCEEAIDERRLTAAPWAGLCIKCQEQLELEGASYRHALASENDSPEF